jgi:hypothetical protein
MHIIDKDGNIIEGQELSPEEVEMLSDISSGIANASRDYLRLESRSKIIQYLITNFHITRRANAEAPAVEEACLEASHE